MERLANYAHLWYNSLGALQVDGCRIAHCYLVANSAHLWYNSRMAQNTTNDETPRTTYAIPQAMIDDAFEGDDE